MRHGKRPTSLAPSFTFSEGGGYVGPPRATRRSGRQGTQAQHDWQFLSHQCRLQVDVEPEGRLGYSWQPPNVQISLQGSFTKANDS